MKKIVIASLILSYLLLISAERVEALSCLPTELYLDEVVGNEEVVIFEATSLDRIEEKEQTVEVLTVTEAKQGWVEEKIFVYHEKHPDWGYLCNQGPQSEGETSVYVATRNDQGQYSVHQRLELNTPLVAGLEADLAADDIEGGISEISPTDRTNQIMSTIRDLIAQIHSLIKEYVYWKNS